MDETSAPREGLLPASRPAEPRRPEAAALDGTDAVASLERSLIGLVESSREQSSEDPFRNPVLAVTLAITKQLDRGGIGADDLDALFVRLRARALAERAERLRAYVGLDEGEDVRALPGRLVDGVPRKSGDFESLADLVSRTAFAVVFTAHPTFGMPRAVASRLAQAASGGSEAERAPAIREAARLSTRPDANIRLDDEFDQACIAANNGREALDAFNGALLDAARARWPDRWGELVPRPFAIASWVGCDTDGRTDIGWWDTLRYRLESKRMQFDRVLRQLPDIPATGVVRGLAGNALAAVNRQLAVAPRLGDKPSLEAVHRFALALIIERERAQTDAGALLAGLAAALTAAESEADKRAIAVLRAGVATHGLSNALPHFRLNATQIHNAVRRVIDVEGEPTDAGQRRSHLATIHALLNDVEEVAVDFGSLAAERASAARLMMTITQILKHVDGTHPVRFLIAETETGYTLLAALWLARHYGIADRIEITPLFETASALEQGIRVLDDALRNPHWRAYLKRIGRLTVQFGYSDSGRYVGQLAATFWIERLRLRLTELLVQNGLSEVELAIFDTHGESIGRGAHPTSLHDRLAYLAPEDARGRARAAGIRVRLESSFQGTDGYLLFGTQALAEAAVARIAEHVYAFELAEEDAFPDYALSNEAGTDEAHDPIYREADFATEFFTIVRQDMQALVDDPGYAALLGTFGPSLIDRTGSRPVARQTDAGGPAMITHPRQMRAIPNNAILHQLGYLANSLHGLGRAAGRAPDLFREMRRDSARFSRAFRLVQHAASVADLDVLRAYIDSLDPAMWLDRARRTQRDARRDELVVIAAALDRLNLAPSLRRLFSRLTMDWLSLHTAAPDLGKMSARLTLLHAIRLALIHRIWFLAVHIPGFRPQSGITREALIERFLRLDIEGCLQLLEDIFPVTPDPTLGLNFGEPAGPRDVGTYEAEHTGLFEPIRRMFAQVREISGMIQHEVGAFG
ncbi:MULTISPECIES: phosphoenolpyruvate carboxylase [Methylobacterium]|uniref:Phosphoenolpyruvate carboxylase n=3 Tax=Pseudomonadota TaxID=1224 RepID=A0ABQ4SXU0_9HYPH|nr:MULTISPECIES: phosphoenolpyruvate carboxylase [Methylobacterium]PIU06300.1 MAG: phosphoenolpyruvate carboxylase [Methylobacterium sp. CG09_land_8_20_14_0_10_71_15]PIU14123.1 MAG: phosphoenolpyruvate carboxylase [Methylobacterium sp. CG08_land_8_20_14_0_20_71_15]GJE06713.1 Phosphoenolpyruvate carboxylase [Methylobacterium jeotgali]